VPLGDAGKLADDPWTQRTFTAVRLVHELDGGGGWGNSWVKAHKDNAALARPVLDLLAMPGLQVFKYWDERPQPVKAANPDVVSIVYSVPGKLAVAAITSYAQQELDAAVSVDAKALGFRNGCLVVNVDGGTELPVENGIVRLLLKKHELKVLRLSPK